MRFFIFIYRFLLDSGFNPFKFIKGFKNIFWYISDFFRLKRQKNKNFPIICSYPCLHDKEDSAGICKGHYFHQDLLVAQEIFKENPPKHVDIASRVDGFITHLASFREVEVLDIRKLDSSVRNIKFKQADLMNIGDEMKDYTSSISCLHAIEHFGLGRYGDSIDINGHLKGLDNIHKILKRGGYFYFSTPIGEQRIEFNAHRVFALKYLYDYFYDKYGLLKFSYVDDKGDLHENIDIENGFENNFGCHFGCGIFKLIKK